MPQLLDQTRSKLEALLRTIEELKAVDFPFSDPISVLSLIETHFNTVLADLVEGSAGTDDATKTMCRRVLEAIGNYLPVLGYVIRSSDLEAPVELHGPLLRLTKRALGDDVTLIIFSEWNYSPFTFLFPELAKRGVVLVGMPRSECENALIASLAGHELGHNIWHREELRPRFESIAQTMIVEEMTSAWESWKDLLKLDSPDQLADLVAYKYLELPITLTVRQAEETFCDLIGLVIFREAYLYAFQYLLAPGDSIRRTFYYPDLQERANILIRAASELRIVVPAGYDKSFDRGKNMAEGLAAHYGALADKVCGRLAVDLISTALTTASKKGLSSYSEEHVANAKKALRQAVPVTNSAGVDNILIAAWRFRVEDSARFDESLPALEDSDRKLVLNELVLKSFEVFEIEQRQVRV